MLHLVFFGISVALVFVPLIQEPKVNAIGMGCIALSAIVFYPFVYFKTLPKWLDAFNEQTTKVAEFIFSSRRDLKKITDADDKMEERKTKL
ncbi:unnamed protein product, partial [Mesorhabditis spiculigera]